MSNDEYLDVKDVMKLFKISRETVYDKTNPNKTSKEHLMPCYKPTGKLIFKRSEVEKWIERHKVKAS
jgi:predicted DNA-binding transcriptional regulator AlpA